MEKLQWFKFSYADWRMGKIQRCPEITQARFMNLCCLYWSKEAELSVEDAEIEIDKEHLDILIAKKVIEEDGKYIFIKFLYEQLEEISETSKGKSKAAKARWDKYREEKAKKEMESTINAEPMHMHTDALQNSAEKRREEKKREEKEDNNTEAKASESNSSSFKYKSSPQEEERKVPQKERKFFKAEVYNCIENCLQYFPETLHPNEAQKNNWLDTIEKLERIDNIPFNLIERITERARADDFWGKNFLSLTKLRKNNKDGVKFIVVFYEQFKSKTNEKRITELTQSIRSSNPNI